MAVDFGTFVAEQFQARADANADRQDDIARATEELYREFSRAFAKGNFSEMCQTPGAYKTHLTACEVFSDWACEDTQMGRLFMFISKAASGFDVHQEAKALIKDCAEWHADQHATDLVAQWEDES